MNHSGVIRRRLVAAGICLVLSQGSQAPGASVTGRRTARVEDPGTVACDAVLILGQSNAVGQGDLTNPETPDPAVWMLGNDYLLKIAYEPVDDSLNQVDVVSRDRSVVRGGLLGHSWVLRAAKGVARRTGRDILLIPCQKGGSRIDNWFPSADRFDRATLYGSANYRSRLVAPDGLKAIWCFGHESSSEPPFDATYLEDWTRLVQELRIDHGPVPMVYAQLAGTTEQPLGYPGLAERLLIAAEKQRQMETLFGGKNALPEHFMVVTFDLPLTDYIHLNRLAVNTLADRFALAVREHVYRQAVNGTGPRMLELAFADHDRTQIRILFDRTVNRAFNNYDNQFRVYEKRGEVAIRRVERDADPAAVLITLDRSVFGVAEVSYGGRPMPGPGIGFPNVIKDSDGLPAPQFWRQKVP